MEPEFAKRNRGSQDLESGYTAFQKNVPKYGRMVPAVVAKNVRLTDVFLTTAIRGRGGRYKVEGLKQRQRGR